MTITELEKEVLNEIKPRQEDYEKADQIFVEVKKEVSNALKELEVEAKIELEGSVAKDTWLRTDPEMDIFVILPKETDKKRIKEIVKVLYYKLKKYKPVLSYAEHPYITFHKESFKIDVVPSIKKEEKDKIKTAVDRTPLHTRFVLENTTPQLRDEIRLVKKFARTIGVYGAEIKTQGFSGYLLELLTIYYNGFRELLEHASKWKPPVIINVASKKKTLVKNEPHTPMIVPDPTDPNRNVASALSLKRLAEFSMASKLYLKKPTKYYFGNMIKINVNRWIKLLEPFYPYVIVIEFKLNEELHPDNLWGEIKRAKKNIKKILDDAGFNIIKCDEWTDEKKTGMVSCILEHPFLPQISHQEGPPYYNTEHSLRFIDKYVWRPFMGPWIDEKGRLNSIIYRKHQHPVEVLERYKNDFMISHLKKATTDIYMLSWKPDVLNEKKKGVWIQELLLGKPKWLLPYYNAIYDEEQN